MQTKLNLYTIDIKYIRELHKVDDNVPSVSPQIGKQHRLFLGIIVILNSKKYCIPLASAKKKHSEMKERADFIKIYNTNNKLIAVLNINYMIPVDDKQITLYNINYSDDDNSYWKQYKSLCRAELNWCRRNEKLIRDKAISLYTMYIRDDNFSAKSRCLNFPKLEEACIKYNNKVKQR